MPSPALTIPAPTPGQVRVAWTLLLAQAAAPDTVAEEERARCLGILLDGLSLIAAGRVCDEAGQALTLGRVMAEAAARDAAADWQAEVIRVGPVERRPFLPELARRVLALGHRGATYPDDDPLLNPRCTRIDPDCADAPLAFARAVAAIEMQSAELLAAIVARHLEWRAHETEQGRPVPVMPWLGPLLEDLTAQCLLVGALAAGDHDEGKALWRRLIAAHAQARQQPASGLDWPAGPLTTCCTLGLLLHTPHEPSRLAEFKQSAEDWPGWYDEDAWPTRHAGADLTELKARLTERAAAALGVAERKLWPRATLAALLEGCWPALLTFCFPLAPCAPGDGNPTPPPPGRGERDAPHP
jgi:hypothetical protein